MCLGGFVRVNAKQYPEHQKILPEELDAAPAVVLCSLHQLYLIGPCQPDIHYTLDPMERLSTVWDLVNLRKYFILHAPRQMGKTTTMTSFVQTFNQEGQYIALYVNVEPARYVYF